jgi:hypothetical protein
MPAPVFPTADEIMLLLLSELPEGVYASDLANHPDPERRSVSSAELRAHAELIALLYANLNLVWRDKFLSTVSPGGLSSWERELFATAQDAAVDFATRQSRLIAKFRSKGGISYAALSSIVAGILEPLKVEFQLAPWCGPFNGAWVLGESELEFGTYLSQIDPLYGSRGGVKALGCDLDAAGAGLTEDEVRDIQAAAYTYELRIFGPVDDATLQTLDAILEHFEAARSTHLILPDHPGNVPVPPPAEVIAWQLDESELDVETYLNQGTPRGI